MPDGADKAKVRDEIEKTKGFMGTAGVVNMSPQRPSRSRPLRLPHAGDQERRLGAGRSSPSVIPSCGRRRVEDGGPAQRFACTDRSGMLIGNAGLAATPDAAYAGEGERDARIPAIPVLRPDGRRDLCAGRSRLHAHLQRLRCDQLRPGRVRHARRHGDRFRGGRRRAVAARRLDRDRGRRRRRRSRCTGLPSSRRAARPPSR